MPGTALGGSPDARGGLPRGAFWLLGLLILLAPALWNGFALLQYDTGGYLARWYEGYLVPSRPGPYGLLLLAGVPFAFWPVLLIQALATLWIIHLMLREYGFAGRPSVALATVAALSLVTTLPILTSILLTDIFAGLMVLGLYLGTFGETLSRRERIGVAVLVAVAASTHNASLALLFGLCGSGLFLSFANRRFLARARAAGLAAIAIAAVVVMLAGNFAVSSRAAFTPGGYGLLFGRMLQSGIAMRFLKERCPDRRLRLCEHLAEIPEHADSFLWGDSVFNRLGRFNGLGEEMRTIVLESIRAYPRAHIRAALTGTVQQLFLFRSGEGVINRIWHTYAIVERYTPALAPAMRAARQQHNQVGFAALNRVHVPVGALSLALLLVLLYWGRGEPALAQARRLAATLLVALLINAVICGALANPHDRYGARLIWLAPLAIILAGLALSKSSTGLRRLLALAPTSRPA